MLPLVTITFTRYAEPDDLVAETLRHLLAQRDVAGEILFIEQQEQATLAAGDFSAGPLTLRIIRRRMAGLSQARNLALEEAKYPLVLFVDADALAEPRWAAELASALRDQTVAVAGSRIVPRWPATPPFFAGASALRDQFSLLDLGPETMPYHRVVGAGFGVDMAKLPPDFRFDETLGRREGLLFGGEESDFCARARALGYAAVYVGSACVTHCIGPERTRLGWIIKRMIYAGHGRARIGGAPAPSGRRTLQDWLLLPLYLPPYLAGWLWGKLSARHSTGAAD